MKTHLALVIFATLAARIVALSRTVADAELEKCLKCICMASTKCVPPRQCWHAGTSEVLICGKYLISEKFWNDAGRVGDKEIGGFYKCAYHDTCAENTLISYFTKFPHDCDRNGEVNCLDLALRHHGEDNCESDYERNTDYFKEVKECWQR